MIFTEDELYCDIFAPILFIQWIFVKPCELADISQAYFFHPLLALFWDPRSFVSRDFNVRFHICF